ncbi:cysteine-rich CWC family protein [Comamonas antarctica]|uniref:Cysteine-rich CWC family protein n=1 Tax=Comamonas antarctica TaxID=2743470 RepID=A0A6N1X1E1_9BURK|nr:cysteine-rich CWC family protein [Comamonas antarctica]QKV51570.1 cysteine-rich CWC family protein [Comamonas antarctica]
MPRSAPPIDPTRCPLCGRSNQCAASAALPPEDCWCMSTPISPAALAQIPDSVRNQSCLCPACAALLPLPGADPAPI